MGWRSGQSYSEDLRDRVLSAVDGGMTAREAAAICKVSVAYICNALIRRRLAGDVEMNPGRGRPARKFSSEKELALGVHIRSHLCMTLAQAPAWLRAERGIALSRRSVECSSAARAVFQKGLRAGEQDRRDVAARRKRWKAPQPFVNPNSVVSLDETSMNTKVARRYGLARGVERCRDSAPFGHWKTMTFIAGLRLAGWRVSFLSDVYTPSIYATSTQ